MNQLTHGHSMLRRGMACVIGMALAASSSVLAAEDWLRIDRPDAALRAQLPLEAIDYGRFIWLPADSLPAAQRLGRGVHHRASPFALPIEGRPMDPALQPDLRPPPSGGRPEPADEPDFHLVQFRGPLKPEWLDELRARGLEPVQAVAPFGYLVWGRPSDLPESAARSNHRGQAVRFAGRLPDGARRLAPELGRGEVHPHSRALIHGPDAERILDSMRDAGAEIGSVRAVGGALHVVSLGALPDLYPSLLAIPGVLSVQQVSQDTGPRGEMSNQSVVALQATNETVVPGYRDWLDQVGLDGNGVVVAVVDAGIRQSHQDLLGQFLPCISGDDWPSSCSRANDNHGTHVAGAIAGTGVSERRLNGFLRGQGAAPGAQLVDQRYPPLLGAGPGGMLPGGMLTIFAESALSGAVLANNSWGPSTRPQGYDIPSREVDLITRNALPGAARAVPILPVWSIMNGSGDGNGACAPSSLGAPDEAKNVLAVGSSNLQRSDGGQRSNLLSLSANSAHGPACDGRTVPQMIAPGCTTDSTTASDDQSYSSNFCGTSMASPVVTGSAALFVEQQRRLQGRDPSPALIRARLTASARDLAGHLDADGGVMGHRPDRKQGWGRLDLGAVIEPELTVFMLDQTRIFSATGQAWTGRFAPEDPTAPMHIMLAWTDAPGLGLGGEMPAWVNDLDLIVHRGADWYYGNAFGADGYSTADGEPDFRNNLEGVVLGAHQHEGESVRVEVLAANLAADALDPWDPGAPAQDFALVCINCVAAPDFTLDIAPQAITACVDAVDLSSQINVRSTLGFSEEVQVTASWLDAQGGGLTLDEEPAPPPFSRALGVSPNGSGSYRILIEAASDGLGSIGSLLSLRLDEPLIEGPAALAPTAQEPVSPATDFAWTALANAEQYRFELALDSDFNEQIQNLILDSPSWQPQAWLEPGQIYFWRVRGINACGEGEPSETFSLQTGFGPATALRFPETPETNGEGGFLSAVRVEVIDSSGQLISSDQSSRIVLLLDDAPAGTVLGGTLFKTVVDGVALFDDLSIEADNDGEFRFRARLQADETLALDDFDLSTRPGEVERQSRKGGLLTHSSVLGVGFAGTVAGISSSISWASDLRLVVTAPGGEQLSLGGADSIDNSDAEWEFQGADSDLDGRYESRHPELFADRNPAVSDQGFWEFEFSNDFSGGQTMRWSQVEIILIKEPIEATSEFAPVRGTRIFRDRFEAAEVNSGANAFAASEPDN